MTILRRTLTPPAGRGLPIRLATVRVPLWAQLLWWVLRRTATAVWWLVRHPSAVIAAAGFVGTCWLVARIGWLPIAVVAAAVCLTAGAAEEREPGTLARWAGRPARSAWRRFWTYRRHWQPAMVTAGLALTHGGVERLPVLGRVRSTAAADVVRARMLPGHTVDQWAKAAEQLAQTFAVREVRVRSVPHDVQRVELHCLTGDPLTAPVPVPTARADVDLTAVPVGRREDGRLLTLPLLHTHLLVGGETGAGKGSVIWSLIVGAAPAIRAGTVRVLAIDPKGGMELAAGARLFHRFVHGGPEEAAVLLEQTVTAMRARAERLRGTTRKFQPAPGDPLVVVVIDELASLVAYVSDPKLRRRLVDALALLLSQGRAVGVTVLAATQDVRKETITLRDLFPVRVALRAAEAEQADMLLGRGSRDRGALTDRIPARLPGVGYVVVDGVPEPVRVRFAHVTDETIARVVATQTCRESTPATPAGEV